MELENLLEQLDHLSARAYGYMGLAALIGPVLLRLLGFKALAALLRPLALVVLAAGLYAKQQHLTQPVAGGADEGATHWL